MAARNLIEVIIKGEDKASAVLGKIGGAVSGLGSVAAGVATGGLAIAAAAVVGLGAAAIGATVGITKLAMAAADVEGTRKTFETLTADLGGADVAINALKESTRGMVSQADLMAASNKFLTMGLTETIEETAEMSEMATQLGLAMGQDATKSMEDFALMMANQSIPRLDTFGISSGTVRERILELMAATEGLTREEAFKIAVMEQGRIAMEKVGEQGESATATTLRWKTAIADLRLGIGKAFIPALEAIRKPVLELVEKYGPRLVEWANIAGKWLGENIPKAIERLEAIWTRYWPEAQRILTTFWETIKPGLEWLEKQLQDFTTNILPGLQVAWAILKRGWDEIAELYHTTLKPALEELWAALQPLWESLGLGKVKTDEIGATSGQFASILATFLASGIIDSIKVGIHLLTIGVKALSWAFETGRTWAIRIKDTFHGMLWVFNEVRHWISVLVEKFNHFKSVLAGFQLPWWLTPGSPTPLETGLLGIEKALSGVQGLAGGGLAFGGLTLAGAGAGRGGGNITTINIVNHFGPGSVRDDEDILEIADAIAQNLELRGIGPVL